METETVLRDDQPLNSSHSPNGVYVAPPTKPPIHLYRKIWEASKLIKSVEKDKENKHHGFWYSSHDAITKACKDAMDEVGLIWLPMSLNYREDRNKIVCEIDFVMVDVDSGESISILWTGWGMDTQDKALYKAETQCKKTFLLMLFRIPTGEVDADSDGDPAPSHRGGQQQSNRGQSNQSNYQSNRNHGGQSQQRPQQQPRQQDRPQQREQQRPQEQREPQRQAPRQQELREDDRQPEKPREAAQKPQEQPAPKQEQRKPSDNADSRAMFKDLEEDRRTKAQKMIVDNMIKIWGKDTSAFVKWAEDEDIVPVDHKAKKVLLDMATAAQVMKLVSALNKKAEGLPSKPALQSNDEEPIDDGDRVDQPPLTDDDAPPEMDDEPPYDDDDTPRPMAGPKNKTELVALVKKKNVKLSSAINSAKVTISPDTIFMNIQAPWAYQLVMEKTDLINDLTSLKLEVTGPAEE